MAITTFLFYALPSGTSNADRSGSENYLRYYCDTQAELPTAGVIDGDRAYSIDTFTRWIRVAGAWTPQTQDNIASYLQVDGGSVYPIGAVADGQVLGRSGTTFVGVTPGAAWGGITGTLSVQTDLQAALDGKLATAGNGSALTGLTAAQVGLANVNNTSDANKPVSTATQTALDAKQATLVSGTNIKTINGSTVLGAGNLAVSASDPSYTPGSFTVATGTGRLILKRMQLLTTERATMAGTARLRVA